MLDSKYDIKIGDLYKKFQGIGSSCNTYALVTGSSDIIIEYEIISDSRLDDFSGCKVKMGKQLFLYWYAKFDAGA